MGQDLRELFKNQEKLPSYKMKEGHEDRFFKKLEEELPVSKKNNMFLFMKIAASVIVIITTGLLINKLMNSDQPIEGPEVVTTEKETPKTNQITLGNVSPELKKVEDYYIANINLELSQIEVTEENKEFLDGYMNRLKELDNEYTILSGELNEVGPNEQNITALINNLQLRLQLLYQLKDKLKELKETQNETFKNQQA
ncbi:hypothetical protein GTQ40_02340 [Flavobacteriaceae bacterium R38]|nr:hypothetical protein [Flavobacteriaceae bacterium R38]